MDHLVLFYLNLAKCNPKCWLSQIVKVVQDFPLETQQVCVCESTCKHEKDLLHFRITASNPSIFK